jgi:hypothetical protein
VAKPIDTRSLARTIAEILGQRGSAS